MAKTAFTCDQIFDGHAMHGNAAILVEDGVCLGVVQQDAVPAGVSVEAVAAWCLSPGFVDLQVNGGGGAQFNDQVNVDGIATICAGHARYGTTSVMVTLITDTADCSRRAVEAAIAAQAANVPGFLGLHLEGPHLSLAKKGAHSADLVRPMTVADLDFLIEAKSKLNHLMMTLAPESVTEAQVRALSGAGVRISLGHSACDAETAKRYTEAGACMVTHLFNAMSPLDHRTPGLAAAALLDARLMTGIIPDGIHVHPDMMRIALRAMGGPRMFAVTDAMATIGTDMTSFELNGRQILRENGRLTLADGTLAGADIDMAACVKNLHELVGLPLEDALAMATSIPALALGVDDVGRLTQGSRADIVAIDQQFGVRVLPVA